MTRAAQRKTRPVASRPVLVAIPVEPLFELTPAALAYLAAENSRSEPAQ